MKRASAHLLLVGVALLSSAAQAQLPTGVTTATITATATIEEVLEFDVIDGSIDCGLVGPGDDGCPDADTAEIIVSANADWDLTLDDFGGAGEDTVTLFVDDFARMGQFIMDLTTDAPDAGNGGTAGPPTNVIITGNIRGTGAEEEVVDEGDDFGPYLGEFLLTLSAQN